MQSKEQEKITELTIYKVWETGIFFYKDLRYSTKSFFSASVKASFLKSL
jgi:hypothetical protein